MNKINKIEKICHFCKTAITNDNYLGNDENGYIHVRCLDGQIKSLKL